jgi:peptidoglycan/LPS O-acetylase OafA/YrhL
MHKPPYYALLDGARGIAALCVLFFHYQSFYYPIGSEHAATDFVPSSQPFFGLFGPIYLYGSAAVQFFWIISGFVFATVYQQQASLRKFASARFARLYPLHVLTLLMVTGLQLIAFAWDGGFLIYQHNDIYHFALNVAFASGWGLQQGEAFNSPIWSVSVEALIYAAFWLSLRPMQKAGALVPLLMLPLFASLYMTSSATKIIGYCGACFYIGVLLQVIFELTDRATRLRFALAALLFAAGPALYFLRPSIDGKMVALASMPGMVLLLASFEAAAPEALKNAARWAGDCSYGIYLWHIPIAITLLLMLDLLVGSREAVSSPWFLALFLLSTVCSSRLSFVLFERPMRERLRIG